MTATDIITDFFGEPTAIRYAPDGSWFAVSSQDGYLRVFDAESLSLLFESHGHTDWATGLAVHPSGTSIVTTGEDGVARVWATQ
jgi:WD40 repeat protein